MTLFVLQFYPNPNMMHWTQPGGFYDINSFLQFNGLSPQAAFKPPTNHNMRYPGSRRLVFFGYSKETVMFTNIIIINIDYFESIILVIVFVNDFPYCNFCSFRYSLYRIIKCTCI